MERLPTVLALGVVPLIGAVVYGVLRGITLHADLRAELAQIRWLYDAVIVAAVATGAATQVLLVVLNL